MRNNLLVNFKEYNAIKVNRTVSTGFTENPDKNYCNLLVNFKVFFFFFGKGGNFKEYNNAIKGFFFFFF